jgi:hypothetical protein
LIALAWVSGRFRKVGLVMLSTLAAIAWSVYLAFQTPPAPQDGQLSIPLLPQLARLFELRVRPLAPVASAAMQALDVAAMLCLLIALGWFAARIRERKDADVLVLPMAAAVPFFGNPALLSEPYDFMRHASVLVACATLRLLAIRPLYAVVYVGSSSAGLLAFRTAAVWRAVTGDS